jgi:phosphinothricin acetyltransferase
MTTLQIRPAKAHDLPRIVAIYNHYVLHTHVTFDTEEVAVLQRLEWFDAFSSFGPHRLMVAQAEDRVVGYASSSRFKVRQAYNTSVETTIYMDPEAVGNGIGTRLYGSLLDAVKAEPSVHRAYGVIAIPNEGSVALHEHFGFQSVGTCHEVGFKFDKYWDVSWFEKDVSS